MIFYLGSPASVAQATACADMPVLLSFGAFDKWRAIEDWAPSFERVLLDSGAYSEINSGKTIDLGEYVEWVKRFPWADAWAGLDSIDGDWRRSMDNYKSGGFPTFHDTDPPDLLDELVAMSEERGGWIGIGVKPPRNGKRRWIAETLIRIPNHIHVHGWALGAYKDMGFDSVDSTNWWRDAFKVQRDYPWLTPAEALEIIVKRYRRVGRLQKANDEQQPPLIA